MVARSAAVRAGSRRREAAVVPVGSGVSAGTVREHTSEPILKENPVDRSTFEQLPAPARIAPPQVDASELTGPNRTLLYGYTAVRQTWHVYLVDGVIHREVFDYNRTTVEHEHATVWWADELLPDKRVYPEDADPQFVNALLRLGLRVPFTTFDDERREKVADRQFSTAIAV